MTPTVVLVRHGETTWNREDRVQGWAGTPLTGRGRDQARATGRRLAGTVDRVVASDLQRTRETTDLLATGGVDAPVTYDRGWRERDFGDLQGLGHETVADRLDAFDPDGSLTGVPDVPGGESRAAFRDRVRDAWATLTESLDDDRVAVVAHGGPIRVVVATVTDRPFPALAQEWSPANCGITELTVGETTSVRARDDTAHLD